MTTPNQPGWYDDPRDSNAQRYWDGQDWTPHRQRRPTLPSARPSAAPPPPPPAQQPPPPPNLPPPPPPPPPAQQPPPLPNLPPPPPPPPNLPPSMPPQSSAPAWTTTKTLAVASLLVGFMSLMLLVFAGIGTFFAPLGALLGALALRRVKKYNEQKSNLALWALILNSAVFAFGVLVFVFLTSLL
jgi:hypothetical protein